MGRFEVVLSTEERDEIRAKASSARARFGETLKRLIDITQECDPIEALARLAITAISGQSRFGSRDYDPLLHVHHLEAFQAFALASPLKQSYDTSNIADTVHQIVGLINENAEAYRDMRLQDLTDDPKSLDYVALIEQLRTSTQTVRGARHAYQTRRYLRDMAQRINERFRARLGFTLSFVLDVVENIGFSLDARLNEFRSRQKPWLIATTVTKMMELFKKGNPSLAESASYRKLRDKPNVALEEVKYVQWNLVEGEFRRIFCFTPADLPFSMNDICMVLTLISIGFGELQMRELETIHLSNPVWTKPFVRIDESLFMLPNPQSLFAFLVEIVDGIIAPHSSLKAAAEEAKAHWLEEKLFALLGKAFPAGDLLENVEWQNAAGQRGETDAVIFIDKCVGLFEAKSGRVSPPAMRGAHERLRRDLKKLLVEPSEQSSRFERVIRDATAPIKVKCSGRDKALDVSGVREFARTNILFQTIGALSSNWPRLAVHGLIPADVEMAPAMSIFDLETIFDALPLQTHRLHYLKRRTEIERNVSYLADELDLLAAYFENGFNFGDVEFGGDGLNMYGQSEAIARAYDHEGRSSTFSLRPKQTPLFQQLIERNETLAPPGWSRFGFRLCSVGYREQMAFRKILEKLLKKGRRLRPHSSVHSGIAAGPLQRCTGIAAAVGKDLSETMIIDHSARAAHHLMSHVNLSTTLVLYWDSGSDLHDYRYIATVNRYSASDLA